MKKETPPASYDCLVPGCESTHHARGLCGAHFQQWRRTGEVPMPENRAKTAREHWIETELVYGCVSERVSKSGSMFETDEERRAAWDERKDELMEKQYTGQPRSNGNRPWAWWEYESARPELRSEPPEAFDFHKGLAYVTRIGHLHEVEKFAYMAAHGHLTEAELEKIAAEGAEAKARIGTEGEQTSAQSPDYGGDKLTAALADAVLGASVS